jgi:hypothetical protein
MHSSLDMSTTVNGKGVLDSRSDMDTVNEKISSLLFLSSYFMIWIFRALTLSHVCRCSAVSWW